MTWMNRRDLVASLAAGTALLASRAEAACDVLRDQIGSVRTKSYHCTTPDGQPLTATFMRLSDVMFDSAGGAQLPGSIGDYQALLRGHRLIDTPALATFTRLFEKHSFAFEPSNVEVAYDLRGDALSGQEVLWANDLAGPRWRTLGVWDETLQIYLPSFPLPDLLRKAVANRSGPYNERFLRHAGRSDFENIDQKKKDYAAFWSANIGDLDVPVGFGNVAMLAEIDAGSVAEFVPLVFSDSVYVGDCDGVTYAGVYFLPPALFVDVAVCRNDGTKPVEIEDFIGAADPTERIRAYDPRTPPEIERFRWDPVSLAPGESALIVQRLLFAGQPKEGALEGVPLQRAVYGPTHLPKGVMVAGEAVTFDGRSHNAVILASFAGCCCCPYLESWCPRAREWIDHGTVLAECNAPEKAGRDTRLFTGARTRFRLSEREHEDTTLTTATLVLTLEDGRTRRFVHPAADLQLTLGESAVLDFEVPKTVAARATHSALTLEGHYQRFSPARLAAAG